MKVSMLFSSARIPLVASISTGLSRFPFRKYSGREYFRRCYRREEHAGIAVTGDRNSRGSRDTESLIEFPRVVSPRDLGTMRAPRFGWGATRAGSGPSFQSRDNEKLAPSATPIISGSLDNFRERYAPVEPPLIAPPKFPSKRTKSMSGNAIRRTLEEELGEGGGEGN